MGPDLTQFKRWAVTFLFLFLFFKEKLEYHNNSIVRIIKNKGFESLNFLLEKY